MSKRNAAGSVLVRLGLLMVVIAGGLLSYQKFVQPTLADPNKKTQLTQGLSGVMGNVEGIANTLHLNSVLDAANKKLVESQPIITDQVNDASTEVLGDTTSNITDTAKQFVSDTATQIGDQIKDLPRQEAVNLTKTVCDQIIKDLEKK